MKRNKMKKNIIGMTLIETLIAITVGISVAVGLAMFMSNLNEKLADSDTANVFIKIAGAMDNRFAIDGYSAANFKKKDWNNNTEVNSFLNSFNGKSSTCSTPDGWVPNVTDLNLKNKQIKSKNIPCNIFKEKAPLDAKMTAKLIINSINNQILTSYVSFSYDTNERMYDAFPRWKNIINEAYNKDTLNNSSKHVYSFMDKTKNTFINDKECLAAKKNCALAIGVVSDEASSLIHLSTIGDNKQVGKLSFSRGLLNPQICQKWSNNGTVWTMEKTICGIENDNEKIGFKLGNVNAGLIAMDKICQLRDIATDGYLNIKDADGNTIPISSINIPCGLNTQTNGGSFVVTAIVDDAKSKELFTEKLVANKFNADVLSVYTMTVNEKTNVTGLTKVDDKVILNNHLFSEKVTSDYTEGESLRSSSGFNVGTNLIAEDSIDDQIVNITNQMNTGTLRTFSMDVGNLTTNSFKSNGSFQIGGDIIADKFTETGVLSAESIALTSNFFVTGSGSVGGYAELGGVANTEKVGITGNDATFKSNYFTRLDPALTDNYMIQIVNASSDINNADENNRTESNINFGVNSHGGIYLRGGINIPNEYGGSSYSVNSAGDLTAVVNFYESSGCCTDAPQQFYGPVGISGTFTIHSNPRYVDVEDINGRNSNFWINPAFILDNPKYPNKQDYRINSLVYNNLRLSSYANKIGEFEAAYNSFDNALHTPGLKGASGDTGEVGLPGDQGKKGKQGVMGTKGLTGPSYNEKSLIWLPKEVTCGKQDSDMTTKYGANNKGAWTYNDVIEGLCTTGKGSVKYFKRLTPIANSCSASQFEYDVYECQEAKFRIEPYAFNNKVQGNFCLGDDLSNKALDEKDPSLGVIDKDNNTICYTDTNNKHFTSGRAIKGWLGNYTSVGGNDSLGTKNKETSVISTVGKNNWSKVATCGADSSRTAEDYLGLSSAELIEDGGATSDFTLLPDTDVNSACKINGAMSYRKVDYTGLKYGGPNEFEAYRVNKYKNVANYLKNNATSCKREQVYEINRCESGVKDLTKLDYHTHPIGFIMPKPEDSTDPGNGGLTGKYIWLKGDKVCLTGTVQESYPGSTDWYSTDRIDTPCSVENAYRSEFLGVCGANSDKSSYQMYACKDEYYKPTQPTLSYRLTDLKCLNSNGQAVDPVTQKPLPVDNIENYYPDAIYSSVALTVGQACYKEREQSYNQENNSPQCSTGYTKFSVYDCR
jgi:type II secretory pathway pseudopilin PulG